jgi:hypothetical protein
MNGESVNKKEGRRRASAQLHLPWVDESGRTYAGCVYPVNTFLWVFDGYVMAEPKTSSWSTAYAPETPGDRCFQVYDRYLASGGFAEQDGYDHPQRVRSNVHDFGHVHGDVNIRLSVNTKQKL